MEKTLFKLVPWCGTFLFILVFNFVPVKASDINSDESLRATIQVTNNTTGESLELEVPLEEKALLDVTTFSLNRGNSDINPIKTVSAEVYVEIPEDDEKEVQLMDAVTYATTNTDSSSSQNTYWKATVYMTYADDGTYITFSKVRATWTQLRGTSTLSNRKVYWGYTLGVKSGGMTKYPSSNDVTYSTNLGAIKASGSGSLIGCNSSVNIATHGTTITLTANISKSF